MRGALITLSSSTMAKSRPTLSWSRRRSACRRAHRSGSVTTGWPSWKVGWASTRFSPLTMTRRLHDDSSWLAGIVLGPARTSDARRRTHAGLAAATVTSTSWKVIFAVLPSSFLSSRDFDARHLDQDAVLALALDGRLARAGLVDAAADDLDRLRDRVIAQRLDRALAQGQRGSRCRASTTVMSLPPPTNRPRSTRPCRSACAAAARAFRRRPARAR